MCLRMIKFHPHVLLTSVFLEATAKLIENGIILSTCEELPAEYCNAAKTPSR
jgi:hypothetical protein